MTGILLFLHSVILGGSNAQLGIAAIATEVFARNVADEAICAHFLQFGANDGRDDGDLGTKAEQFFDSTQGTAVSAKYGAVVVLDIH